MECVRENRGRGGKKPGPAVRVDLCPVTDADGKTRHEFVPGGPNRLWLTDITEHRTAQGKLYQCAIKDVYAGKTSRLKAPGNCQHFGPLAKLAMRAGSSLAMASSKDPPTLRSSTMPRSPTRLRASRLRASRLRATRLPTTQSPPAAAGRSTPAQRSEKVLAWVMVLITVALVLLAWAVMPHRAQLQAPNGLVIDIAAIPSASRAVVTVRPPEDGGAQLLNIRLWTLQRDTPPQPDERVWVSSFFLFHSVEGCEPMIPGVPPPKVEGCWFSQDGFVTVPEWEVGKCSRWRSDLSDPCYVGVVEARITPVNGRRLLFSADGMTAVGVFPNLRVAGRLPSSQGEPYGTDDTELSEAVFHLPLESRYQIVSGPVPGFVAGQSQETTTWYQQPKDLGGPTQSILAVDRAQERRDSVMTFLAGAFVGLAGGSALAAIEALVRLSGASDRRHRQHPPPETPSRL